MKRFASVLLVLLIVLAGLWVLRGKRDVSRDSRAIEFVATLRSEPRSLNRLLAGDRPSLVVSQLIHEPLVRVNHVTQAIEPALAASWTTLDDGRRIRFALRTGARFSDGSAITADDVVFSLAAVYDPRLASPLADALTVNGAPITARAIDAQTVELTYPAPYGPGVRPLHGLPILPRAHYARQVAEGTLAAAWTPTAAPAAHGRRGPVRPRTPRTRRRGASGAQPALLASRRRRDTPAARRPAAPGHRAVAGRRDAAPARRRRRRDHRGTARRRPAGGARAGRAGAPAAVRARPLARGRHAVVQPAPAPVAGGAEGSSQDRRAWLRRRELREAISHAVDRTSFINAVYRGAARPGLRA